MQFFFKMKKSFSFFLGQAVNRDFRPHGDHSRHVFRRNHGLGRLFILLFFVQGVQFPNIPFLCPAELPCSLQVSRCQSPGQLLILVPDQFLQFYGRIGGR